MLLKITCRDDWISAIEEVSKRLKKEEEKRQSLIEKPKEVQTKTLVSKPFSVKLLEQKIWITNESLEVHTGRECGSKSVNLVLNMVGYEYDTVF